MTSVPTIDRSLSAAVALERALGDPLDDTRNGSFSLSVAADRESRFPRELCAAAFDQGLAEQLVPEECGGRLRSVAEVFALSRVLSRRDLTATIAIGAGLLASLPVWLRGSAEQKRAVARLVRDGEFLSFALSEREHGADILASDVSARPAPHGWTIDGTKWLINNAGHAAAAVVTARTGEGFRGLTLFLLTRDAAGAEQWTPLPKIHTHGLRGSAFGGLHFCGLQARDGDIIGARGQGLQLLLETLQITRVLVASFALGGLDTCLRASLSFARSRRLYGSPIVDLEPVARRLVDAYAELLIGETVALGACRAVQLCPDQLPLTSACVKALVPMMATDSIESLSVTLGARSYLAVEHWHGIFEKMRRDCAVTSLFDGSLPVNLDAIVSQLPGLALARSTGGVDEVPAELFSPSSPDLPWLDEVEFELETGSDAIHSGLNAARDTIGGEALPLGARLLELLEHFEVQTARVDDAFTEVDHEPEWRRSGAAYDLAIDYCHLHAAGACCWKWLAWRAQSPDEFIASGAWLVLCLRRLAERTGMEPVAFDDVDRAALARLERAYDEHYLFSDLEFPLC